MGEHQACPLLWESWPRDGANLRWNRMAQDDPSAYPVPKKPHRAKSVECHGPLAGKCIGLSSQNRFASTLTNPGVGDWIPSVYDLRDHPVASLQLLSGHMRTMPLWAHWKKQPIGSTQVLKNYLHENFLDGQKQPISVLYTDMTQFKERCLQYTSELRFEFLLLTLLYY